MNTRVSELFRKRSAIRICLLLVSMLARPALAWWGNSDITPTTLNGPWATSGDCGTYWYVFDRFTACTARGANMTFNCGFAWNGRGYIHLQWVNAGNEADTVLTMRYRNQAGGLTGETSTWNDCAHTCSWQSAFDRETCDQYNYNGIYRNADEDTNGGCGSICGFAPEAGREINMYGDKWVYLNDWIVWGGYGNTTGVSTVGWTPPFGENGIYVYGAIDTTHGNYFANNLYGGKTPARVQTGDCGANSSPGNCTYPNYLNFQGNANVGGIGACANCDEYAFCWVNTASGAGPQWGVGSDDGDRIWLNGTMIADNNAARGVTWDQDRFLPTGMVANWNRVLFKVHQGGGGSGGVISLHNGTDFHQMEPAVTLQGDRYGGFSVGYEQDAWFPTISVSSVYGNSSPTVGAAYYGNSTSVSANGTSAASTSPAPGVPYWKTMYYEWGYNYNGNAEGNYTPVSGTPTSTTWSHSESGVTGHRRFHFFAVSQSGRTSGQASGSSGGWTFDSGHAKYYDVYVDNVAPQNPSFSSVSVISTTQINLGWAIPLDQGVNIGAGSTEAQDATEPITGSNNYYRRGDVGVQVYRNTSTTLSAWSGTAISFNDTGLTANSQYTYTLEARDNTSQSRGTWNNTTGQQGSTSAWTLSVPPASATISGSPSNVVVGGDVTWTANGFGAGKVQYYRYAFDTSPTHTFTGSETQWSTGTISTSPTSAGTWYLHVKGYNGANVANGTFDYPTTASNPVTLTCASNKTVECGTTWSFDPPIASGGCCTNLTITVLSTTTNSSPPGGPCNYTVTRTWQATDCCGLAPATCSQTVTVQDTTPPALTCATNKTVDCASTWSFDPPTAFDTCCGTNVTITVVTTFTNASPTNPCAYFATRKWLATDCCSNGMTCTQTVTVQDTAVITCASNKVVECGSTWAFDPPTGIDSCCGVNLSVYALSTVTNSSTGAVCRYDVTQTWVATNCCGNASTCSQTVTIQDTTPPVITCFSNKVIECGTLFRFDRPTAVDACCGTNVTILVVGNVTNVSTTHPCTYDVTRTWKAQDCCQNLSAACSQTITVQDTTPPNITCGPNKTAVCGSQWSFDTPTASDTCCGTNVTITPLNTVTNPSPADPCSYNVTQTWQATDCCGNSSTCSQTVSLSGCCASNCLQVICPTNKTVVCGSSWTFDSPSATTCCTNGFVNPDGTVTNVLITPTGTVTNGICPQTITETWTITDACGNTTNCSQTVTVQPCVPPPSGYTLWLPFDEPVGPTSANLYAGGNNGTQINNPTVDVGQYVANSLCFDGSSQYVKVPDYPAINPGTGDLSIDAWVKRDPNSGNSPPRVVVDKRDPNTGIGYSLSVSFGNLVFQLADSSGFTNYRDTGTVPADGKWHFVAVTVNRTSTTGGQFYVDCAATANFDPTGQTGNLNNTNAFLVGASFLGGNAPWMGCIDEVEFYPRQLTAAEVLSICSAGAAGKCKQPLIVCAPEKTVECGSAWSFDPPQVNAPCCGTNVTVTILSTVTNVTPIPCTLNITRTWQVTDCCSNTATCSQTVFVQDTTPPAVSCAPGIGIICGTPLSFTDPTAYDACCGTNVTITVLNTVTNGHGCDQLITRTWTITDCCGNSTNCSQTIQVGGSLSVTCARDKTVECGSQWNFDPPIASNPCCGTNITITVISTVALNNNGQGVCFQQYQRTWSITDCCGNTQTCRQTVTITDTTPPIVSCSRDKNVECGTDWEFDPPSAYDTCCGDNITIQVVGAVTNSPTPGSPCVQDITQTWLITDCCGNSTNCSQTVHVRDTTPPIFTGHCVTNRLTAGFYNGTFTSASPSLALANRVGSNRKDFGDCTVNEWVAHTFSNLPPCITSATLTIYLRPCGDNCENDDIGVWFTTPNGPSTNDWSSRIGTDQNIPGIFPDNWCNHTNGDVIVLNLANMPFTGADLIPALNQNGFMDFICEDDTAIDTLILDVVSCCCAPSKAVACNSQWHFDDPTAVDACCGTNVTVTILSTVTNYPAGTLCQQQITRTWVATDCCGNTNTCSQTITVRPCQPAPSGYTLWLPFDELAGPTSANLYPGGNSGTQINNPTVDAGEYVANSLCFDGASQSVHVPDYPAINPGTGDLSIDAWVKRSSQSASVARIIVDKRTPNPLIGYSLAAASVGNLVFQLADSSGYSNYGAIGVLPADDQWHFVAVTVNRSSTTGGRFYVDGAPVGTFDPTGHPGSLNNTNDFEVGASPVGGNLPWLGCIDEVEFFPRVLTASEVASIYNAGTAGKCKQPLISCAPDKTVECGSTWTFDPPQVNSPCCGTNFTVTILNTVIIQSTTGCTEYATRTWQVVDCCSNTATCSQTVTIQDTTPPVVSCAPGIGVICGTPWSFTPPTAYDACCGTNVTISVLSTVTNGHPCNLLVTRTWTITDCCGNSTNCSQSIQIGGGGLTLTCASNKTVECGTEWTFDPPNASAPCCGTNFSVLVLNTVTNPGPTGTICGETITRTWQAVDCCQDTLTCSQTVTVQDTRPPVLTCVSNKTVACGTQWTFDRPTAYDACCGTNVTIIVLSTVTNYNSGSLCSPTITRTWQATDCCGNSITCSQSVSVQPCVPPPSGFALWLPFDELAGPTSANLYPGGNNGTQVNNPTVDVGQYVGNSLCFDGSSQWVTVPDYPAINPGTGDLSIDAWVKRDPNSGNSPPRVIVDKRNPNTGIGYSLSVSFGNLVFQLADFSGFTNYRDTGTVPADGQWHFVAVTVHRTTTTGGQFYVDCVATATFDPTGQTGNLNNTNAFLVGASLVGGNGPWMGCIDEVEFFPRQLTAAEVLSICSAGPAGKCKQPLITCAPNKTVECGSPWTFNPPEVNSPCCGTNFTVTILNTVTNPGPTGTVCGETITRTWKVVDCCGASATCNQTVTIQDTTPPAVSCAPGIGIVCGTPLNFTPPSATDTCCGTNVIITVLNTVTNGHGCNTLITRTWTITDCCGNSTNCSQTIQVGGGSLTVTCASNKTVVCGTPWTFDPPAASNPCCGTNISIVVSGTSTNGPVNCTNTIVRTWLVTDCCGNTNSCSQTIKVIPPPCAPVVITSITYTAAGVTICFPTKPCLLYDIQYKDNFGINTPWTTLQTVAGNGSIICVTEPGGRPSRFYRIVCRCQ